MTSEEKIWHILEIIEDARKLAPIYYHEYYHCPSQGRSDA